MIAAEWCRLCTTKRLMLVRWFSGSPCHSMSIVCHVSSDKLPSMLLYYAESGSNECNGLKFVCEGIMARQAVELLQGRTVT